MSSNQEKSSLMMASEQFLYFRGMFLTAFAQVEWFMAKILIEAHAFPEYHDLNLDFSIQAETRAKKIRILFNAEGRLHKYANDILPAIKQAMDHAEQRNFMAHGLVITTPSQEHGAVFRMKMFKRLAAADDQEGFMDFTAEQLKGETTRISSAAKAFIAQVKIIWAEQGMAEFEAQY